MEKNIYQKRYNKANRPKLRRLERKYLEKLKYETLFHYSYGTMKCLHCRYNNPKALVIDHINDDGAKMRGSRNLGGVNYYKKLRKAGFPDGHQVLCCNCNYIKQVDRLFRNRL